MKLNKIFSSNMVFAHGKPIRVYGTGDNDVTVTFANTTKTVSSENGFWLAEFPPMEYGGPYELIAESNGERVQLTGIYVGKVILFAGQSNIELKLNNVDLPPEKYETNDKIRFFCTDRISNNDFYCADDGWVSCTKDNAGYFSAIGYIASTEIRRRDGVAVGAVGCYQGASVIETWLPEGTYERLGIEIPISEKTDSHVCEPYSAWNGKDGRLYEFAFSQVVPFSFNAVVWYQGESDATEAEAKVYHIALCELIDVWRRDLKDPTLPFVIVQIADFDGRRTAGWYGIQDAQLKVSSMRDNVETVISRDVCDSSDIHPRNKTELSKRIAELL